MKFNETQTHQICLYVCVCVYVCVCLRNILSYSNSETVPTLPTGRLKNWPIYNKGPYLLKEHTRTGTRQHGTNKQHKYANGLPGNLFYTHQERLIYVSKFRLAN